MDISKGNKKTVRLIGNEIIAEISSKRNWVIVCQRNKQVE